MLILISVLPVKANDYWRIAGYYKSFFVANAEPFASDSPKYGRVTNRLRTNIKYTPSKAVEVDIAYDFTPTLTSIRLQQFDDFLANLDLNPTSDYRADDLDLSLYPRDPSSYDEFRINQNLDRLLLTVHVPFADMYFGRQAIAWGSARVINPTDILAPFSYDALDVEDRRGVDAARIRIPIGFMGEIDAGYLFGKDFDYNSSAMYLRAKDYFLKTDISALAINFQENLLLGIDLARSIGGAGAWLEAAWVDPDLLNPDGNVGNEKNYLRVTVGADYSFGDKTYGFLEYHYNQAGSNEPSDYLAEYQTIPYREGGVFLLGEHYIIPGVTYQITPLIIFSGTAMFNISDQSILLIPKLDYNISENIYLSGGAYVGLGKEGRLPPLPLIGYVYGSEFGDYPNMYFTSFRVYF